MRKSKIRVLHIIKSLGRGGAEMLLPETLKLHDKAKFDFHYIYFLPWKDQMVGAIKDAGGKITCFSANDNIRLIAQGQKVIEYCERNKIQLIHCHLPWAGFLGRYVFARTKIPMIYTEHNMQERYHVVTKTINKYTFNYQSLAIGVSNDVSNSIQKNINPKIPVKTLLNGVNTDAFIREEQAGMDIRKHYGIPEKAVVIGNVAVFSSQKRIKEWLQVFGKISAKRKSIYGIIVGAGPLEADIKEQAAKLDLEKKVFFPGLQSDVKPYLSAIDIFMISSAFEGLPIALLEAMSMNCAVVATNAGGIKEVIGHKENGLTCEVDEWQNLVDLGIQLIDDPNSLERLKREARKTVERNFSLKSMVDSLEETYQKFVRDGD